MTKPIPFEESMSLLQEIVIQLEKGELPLDESLKQYEKGITIARNCQDILTHAEQKIEELSTQNTPLIDDLPNE